MPATNKTKSIDYTAIWTEFRERVRDAYPIDHALRDYTQVQLRRAGGDRMTGCCPFHQDKTPSFSVDTKAGYYKCFTMGCEAKGDLFKLIQDVRGVDFRTAILEAADKVGIEVPTEIAEPGQRPARATFVKREVRPADEVGERPDLEPCDMTPIPDTFPRARPNQSFRLWKNDEGNRRGIWKQVPEMVHDYKDVDGRLLCSILRVIGRDGRKIFIPARALPVPEDAPRGAYDPQTRLGWVMQAASAGHARPIYGIERTDSWIAAGAAKILIIEGEKTADATRRLVTAAGHGDEILVLTTLGGGAATMYADWSSFVKRLKASGRPLPEVTIWPDADAVLTRTNGEIVDRQVKFARQVSTGLMQALIDEGIDPAGLDLKRVIPPSDVESGWDLADAEKEGWSPASVMSWMRDKAETLDKGKLNLKPLPQAAPAASEQAREAPEPVPFEWAGDDTPAIIDLIETFFEIEGEAIDPADLTDFTAAEPEGDAVPAQEEDTMAQEARLPHEDEAAAEAAPIAAPDEAPLTEDDVAPADEAEAELFEDQDGSPDLIDEQDTGGTPPRERHGLVDGNPYFRCLGHLEGKNYFLSLQSLQMFDFAPSAMRSSSLLHLAPITWWRENFGYDSRGKTVVNWEDAADACVQETYKVGVWDPSKEVGKGARLDQGRVVFHTGNALFVDGVGFMSPRDFLGDCHYTVSAPFRMPAVENPFLEESLEVNQLLDIIKHLDWRAENRELSVMSLFGWIAIAPICGILKWRPHLWLDGPTGSGKSWVLTNIVAPALGQYRVAVKSNSSESGLRHWLHKTALPPIFDEAEGEGKGDRNRMDEILKLARHSASDGDSVVVQGVSGGGGQRYYSIRSMFLLSSISNQVTAAADKSRFARAHLARGRGLDDFIRRIEVPAAELLTEEFADRLLGRMLVRARDYLPVYRKVVGALTMRGMERRLADVYGTFATGVWLALRDGVPEDEIEVLAFITEKFGSMGQMDEINIEVRADRDHDRVIATLMAHDARLENRNGGLRMERLGTLIALALGLEPEDDTMVSADEAESFLRSLGFRVAKNGAPCTPADLPDEIWIHKNAPPISKILEDTNYSRSYADVLLQAEGASSGPVTRFRGLMNSRVVRLPVRHLRFEID